MISPFKNCTLIFPFFLFCLFNLGVYNQVFCQIIPDPAHQFVDSTTSYVEIVGFGSSTQRTPFWLQTNQFGIVPRMSPAGSLRLGAEHFWKLSAKEDSGNSPWRLGFGVEAVANLTQEKPSLLLPQMHASLRYKNWELYVGRKRQVVGLADSTLGTGPYAFSGNAMPIPRIQFGTINFVNVPFTKGWLSFRAFYSDGLMDKNRPVTTELKLHQKALYLRIGKASSKFKLYGGFNHQVEWGGKTPYNTVNGQMPVGFVNYLNVITGKAQTKTLSIFDSTGRVGNHLGSVDVALEIETYEMSIFIYRQSIYDDGSLIWLENIKDGLNGIRFRRKNSYGADFEIMEAVVEFLYTKNQGGPSVDVNDRFNRGKDDYFNNGQVRDGWSYHDRTVGTPFITPTSDTQWKYPVYSDFFTSNNRVSVIHLGLKGNLFRQFQWSSKLSYSSNAGTYNGPFFDTPTQFSGLFSLQTRVEWLGGLKIQGSVATDMGKLYRNTTGFSLGIRKEGLLKAK